MLHSISPEALSMLLNNQEICKSAAPVTTRATFKLSQLKLLIEAIEKSELYQADKDDPDGIHNVCITFVREDLNDVALFGGAINGQTKLAKYKTVHEKREFSQLIPIITGCSNKLNNYKDSGEFKYLRINGGIPCVRPGGEGTGLIPPPPTGSDDTTGAI